MAASTSIMNATDVLIQFSTDGITYTTLGIDPFSIKNEVNQDVWEKLPEDLGPL